eukprot:jgi/Chrpa1/21461/Chrysochromulina_OHIO_Genome00008585-RA
MGVVTGEEMVVERAAARAAARAGARAGATGEVRAGERAVVWVAGARGAAKVEGLVVVGSVVAKVEGWVAVAMVEVV